MKLKIRDDAGVSIVVCRTARGMTYTFIKGQSLEINDADAEELLRNYKILEKEEVKKTKVTAQVEVKAKAKTKAVKKKK